MGNELERVLRTRTILLWGAGLLVVAALAATVLLSLLGGGRPQDSARLDALRTAANIVVGTGGAAALLLAARRQRSAELDLLQKDHDSTERRVTEMYSKAADQLGSDKAPVRLAGMYALERLAQDYRPHRQTIVNVLCAYLRMPHQPEDTEEAQVRLTAQRILVLHLRRGPGERPAETFWPGTDLDLSGAELTGLRLTHCTVRSLTCYDAQFHELVSFRGSTFETKADFNKTRFGGRSDFRGVTFGSGAETFNGAEFVGPADFGTKTPARLAGAVAKLGLAHTWPRDWEECPIKSRPDWAQLTRKDVPADPGDR